MSAIRVQLPESLHKTISELAKQDNVSIDHFVALALAEKVSALMTEKYLSERAQRGNREAFDAALERVADIEPENKDKL